MDAGHVRDWYVRVLMAERLVLDWLRVCGDVDMTRSAAVRGGIEGAAEADYPRHLDRSPAMIGTERESAASWLAGSQWGKT